MSTPSRAQSSTTAAGRRLPKDTTPTSVDQRSSISPSRSNGKQASPASNSSVRSKSVRTPGPTAPISSKSAVRRPGNVSSNATNARNGSDGDSTVDDDTKAQTAATIEDLQDRLRQAEEASESYSKQAALLQARLDSVSADQSRLEETIHELTEKAEDLENQKRDSLRSRRELEVIYESDRAASIKFKEEAQAREDQLSETIQRLKDTLAQRSSDDDRKPNISRTSSFRTATSPQPDGTHFAPSTSLQRSDSRSSSRLVLQKDKIIESLRIELAEAQIRLVEMENAGGGQLQELEKSLMETRMTNARLMEENDSFQLLLSEKTLSGDLSHNPILAGHTPAMRTQSSSLADELNDADGDDEDEGVRQFKVQIASLKDENKALTLYINNIISRLLQHDIDFILDKNADPSAPSKLRALDTDLRPPVPEKDGNEGFLSKTMSAIGARKPRPMSMVMPETAVLTPNEDPATAPSIPIGRAGHRAGSGGNVNRRSMADWNSAAVVSNMYRGPSPTRSGQLSPGITSPRNSFLGSRPNGSSRVTSGSTVPTITESEKSDYVHRSQRDSKISSGRNSIVSDTSRSASPPPPSTVTNNSDKGTNSIMVGSKMRPLRLVQENADEEAARKAANRASWMGWFNKGT